MSNRICHLCGSVVPDFEAWGVEVRQARIDLGLTLMEFALGLSCSAARLSELERGLLCAPSPALRAHINDELGIEDAAR